MNASRRICCNAANAFKPSLALRSVFTDSIGRSSASSQATNGHHSSRRLHTGQARQKVYGIKNLDFRQKLRDEEIWQQDHDPALVLDKGDVPKMQQAEPAATAETLQEEVNPDGSSDDPAIVDLEATAKSIEDIYIDEAPPHADAVPSAFRSPKLAEIADKKKAGKSKEVLEYEGKYVQPQSNPRHWTSPWLEGLDLKDKSVTVTKRYGITLA